MTNLARVEDDQLPEVNGNGLVYTGPTRGLGGFQARYRFPNGYGASIIQNSMSYGREGAPWELAVIWFASDDDDDWDLVYDTPITDDVLGWLSPEDVDDLLDKIAALPAK